MENGMQKASSILGPEDYVSFLEYLNKKNKGEPSEEELIRRYFHTSGAGEQEYFNGIAHRAYLEAVAQPNFGLMESIT
jgi:hypothetical protein